MSDERLARCKHCRKPPEMHYRGRKDGELHCFDEQRGRLTGQHYAPDGSALLSALPVVEDAADHREEDHMADDDEFPPRYSGDNSKDFWDRVNALPKAHWAEAYSLGVALQNLEGQVLRALTKHKRRRARAGEER